MGEILKWSPGLLYQEEATPLSHVCFRYPSGLESAGLLALTAVGGIGLLSWYIIDRSNGLWMGVSGAFTLFMATMAVLRIWEQRLVTVDRDTREITYLRRDPFRIRRDVVQAVHLREVRIEEWHDSEAGNHWLFLMRMNGDRILLGGGTLGETFALGRRMSELLRLPLEVPPSDNLRSR